MKNAAAHQVQEHSEGVPGSLWVLQDLCQSLANQGHGTVQLHVTADQHVTCSKADIQTQAEVISSPRSEDSKGLNPHSRPLLQSSSHFLSLLTSPVGGVREVFAALQRLHGFGQRRAGFGPVEESRVERVGEEFGRGDGDRPQGDAHALDSSSQKGSGQTHHSISSHPAAGLWVQPGVKEVRGQVGGEP